VRRGQSERGYAGCVQLGGTLGTFHSTNLVGVKKDHVAAALAGDLHSFGAAGMKCPERLPQRSKPALRRLSLCAGVGVAPPQQAQHVTYMRHGLERNVILTNGSDPPLCAYRTLRVSLRL
jgi:hypothetical protein